MAMTIVEAPPGITGGVDTHLDVHVAAALDPLGRLIGTESFTTDAKGYRELLAWLRSFGVVTKVGVEGTGAYGAGLARFLRRQGVHVVEVMRPNRQARRNSGKTDTLDAVEAARAALSGKAKGHAKTRDGAAEAIRTLVVAKRSARQARVKALVQMRHLVVSAPDELHQRCKGLSVAALIDEATSMRPDRSPDPVTAATKSSLSSLAKRIRFLSAELASLDEQIAALVAAAAPALLASDSGLTRRRHSSSRPETTPSDCTPRRRGRGCAGSHPSRRTRGRSQATADWTREATVKPTARCGAS
jgi:transposase